MTPTDVLIRGRDYILDRLTGANPSLILNVHGGKKNNARPDDLASKLKQTLQDLKAAVMDESGSRIDYGALRTSPAYVEFQENCLSQLHTFNPLNLPTTNARRAFWINLYNALVLDAVISLDVDRSVTEGFIGAITFFRRAAYSLNGKRMSLDDIEHGILRGNRGHPLLPGPHFVSDDPRLDWVLTLDPRIHFALNCGGRSCPPIRAYEPGKLEMQLDLAVRSYLETNVTIRSRVICLSQLFRWYRADFGGRTGVAAFLTEYMGENQHLDAPSMEERALRFRYAPYDWGLNVLSSSSR